MEDYNILGQVKEVADRYYDLEKPDRVTDNDWAVASPETKNLLVQVEEVKKPLEDAYWEAIRQRYWERAFFTFQSLIYMPFLFSLDRGLWGEMECIEREIEYTARAKEWIVKVEELLQWEQF